MLLYDTAEGGGALVADWVRSHLERLEREGSLRGGLSAEEQGRLIRGAESLGEAVGGAKYVQVRQTHISEKEIENVRQAYHSSSFLAGKRLRRPGTEAEGVARD